MIEKIIIKKQPKYLLETSNCIYQFLNISECLAKSQAFDKLGISNNVRILLI